jgi:hypothetical protein
MLVGQIQVFQEARDAGHERVACDVSRISGYSINMAAFSLLDFTSQLLDH